MCFSADHPLFFTHQNCNIFADFSHSLALPAPSNRYLFQFRVARSVGGLQSPDVCVISAFQGCAEVLTERCGQLKK